MIADDPASLSAVPYVRDVSPEYLRHVHGRCHERAVARGEVIVLAEDTGACLPKLSIRPPA